MSAKSTGVKRRSTQDKLPVQQQVQQQQQQVPQVQSQLGGKVAKALEKAEARKQKRLARQAQVTAAEKHAQWLDIYILALSLC